MLYLFFFYKSDGFSSSHNHGSGKWLYLKGKYYWRDPFLTSMIMGGRVSTLESSPQDAKASKRKEADALPAVEDGNFPVSSVLFERRLALVMNAVFLGMKN